MSDPAVPRRPRAGAGVRARLRAPGANRTTSLHPGAWWLWALGLATAASRTTNPLLLALLVAVAGYVVAARRSDAPWARSYGAFLKLGLLVLGIRLVFAFFLGSPIPGSHVLVTLPEVPLPDWAQGVRIGGRVTAEGLVFALYDALKLATLLICIGAANALANPARLLKALPGALYEAGVAVVVAMTFAPNLVADVRRLRTTRRLRGRRDRGVRAVLSVGLPVLEGALERSVGLAAAMDARGYGRTARVHPAIRRTTATLTLAGLLGLCVGSYALLAAQGAALGIPLLLVGAVLALAGLWLGGRRTVRTRYRPERWGVRAWLVAGSGAAVAALMLLAAGSLPTALAPPAVPLTAPPLPLWPAAAVLLGLLPAFVAPAPVRAPRADGARGGAAARGRGSGGNAGSAVGSGDDADADEHSRRGVHHTARPSDAEDAEDTEVATVPAPLPAPGRSARLRPSLWAHTQGAGTPTPARPETPATAPPHAEDASHPLPLATPKEPLQ